mgnify:CR=1 FL=1
MPGAPREPGAGWWGPLLLLPSRRPLATLTLLLLLALGSGAALSRGLVADFGLDGLRPAGDPEFARYRDLSALFGRDDNTAFVFVDDPRLLGPRARDALAISDALADSPLVAEVTGPATVTVVEERDGRVRIGPLLDRTRLDEVDWPALRARLTGDPAYAGRVVSPDGRTLAWAVRVRDDRAGDAWRPAVVAHVDGVVARFAAPGRSFFVTGSPHTRSGYLAALRRDATLFTGACALLLGLSLGLFFRSWQGVVYPLAAVLLALLYTGGVQALSGRPIGLLSAAVPVMVLIVGISDAIHLLQRWGEELAVSPAGALERAVVATARACLLTSLITSAGFFLLPTTGIPLLGDLGLVVGAGVLLCYLVTLSLLPALGALFAPPPARPLGEAVLGRLGGALLARRRPLAALALAAILGLGALGAPRLRVESRVVDDLPPDHPLLQTRAAVEARMGGNFPLWFLVHPRRAPSAEGTSAEGTSAEAAGAAEDPALLAAVASFQAALQAGEDPAAPTLARTLSAADVLGSMWRALGGEGPLPPTRAAVAQLLLVCGEEPLRGLWDPGRRFLRVEARLHDRGTAATFALVERAEAAFAASLGDRARLEVQGFTYLAQRVHREVVSGCLTGFGLDFALVAAMIGLLFRSLRMGLLALLPNLLPLVGTLGFMGLAGVELRISSGLVFCVVFGIAVDDTVHFLARYQEERAAGHPPPLAVSRTLASAGRAMLCMSGVLAAGFGVLLLSQLSPNRALGLLLPVTVGLGLVSDLVLLPALLLAWDRDP